MGLVRMTRTILDAKQTLTTSRRESRNDHVKKGHFAVYVGSNKHRFVVPITYLKHPLFQDLLRKSQEEFGFDHPITIPCTKDAFLNITSYLNHQSYS